MRIIELEPHRPLGTKDHRYVFIAKPAPYIFAKGLLKTNATAVRLKPAIEPKQLRLLPTRVLTRATVSDIGVTFKQH